MQKRKLESSDIEVSVRAYRRELIIVFYLTINAFFNMSAQNYLNQEKTLNAKQESIVPIAAYTAIGDQSKLKIAIYKGLDKGLTINETKEILVQLYAYAGFPRSLNAINTLEAAINERKQKGIEDVIGKEASGETFAMGKYSYGKNVQTKLTGSSATGSAQKFVPVIDTFLKVHLFADIFSRDNLDYQSREIATISALATLKGTEAQLKSHLSVGKNTGLTEQQLRSIASILSEKIGAQEGNTTTSLIDEMFNSKNRSMTEKSYQKNPFGLVYRDAISENIIGKVNIHPVSYKVNGIDIAANVYTPANYDPTKKYPAIVVAHPNGGVKEQTAGLYAQRLAEAGYITIAADAAFQGASGGEPRHTDKPFYRIEDIHGMADFITQYAGVDEKRLGVLGICGGGGYTLKAAESDKRFKAVATLSMFNSGEVRRNGFQNAQLATVQERLKKASDARAQEATGGEMIYAGVASITDEEIAKTSTDLYREGYEYYYRTHAHPNSTFLYTMSSLLDLMTWDAASNLELINQPTLMIAGSKADTKYMTDEAFEKLSNAKSKELFLLDGTHIQTYWKLEYVDKWKFRSNRPHFTAPNRPHLYGAN